MDGWIDNILINRCIHGYLVLISGCIFFQSLPYNIMPGKMEEYVITNCIQQLYDENLTTFEKQSMFF